MSFTFRPAVRSEVGLILGFAGGTGSGKTYSSLRVAKGMTPPGKRFALIDTENGRAKFYADEFAFDHGSLEEPFNPLHYVEAIQAADRAGYPVIVVDSMSHSWAGPGGVLDMQEAEFKRLGGRDAIKLLSWAAPKSEHKAMVSALLRVKAHLILCFRAEPKVDMIREDGKTKIVPKESPTGLDGWISISDKNLPFELSASWLLMADRPGFPKPIKLPEKLRPLIPLNKPIDEEAGARLAEWARGGAQASVQSHGSDSSPQSEGREIGTATSQPVAAAASVPNLTPATGAQQPAMGPVAEPPATEQQLTAFWTNCTKLGYDHDAVHKFAGWDTTKGKTRSQLAELQRALADVRRREREAS